MKPSSYARHVNEYDHIIANLRLSNGGSIETVVPPLLGGAIDEVGVEWCILCGKEGDRAEMELREIELTSLSKDLSRPGEPAIQRDITGCQGRLDDEGKVAESHEARGSAVKEREGEKGIWWVCKGGCVG